jgi:Caspase domain
LENFRLSKTVHAILNAVPFSLALALSILGCSCVLAQSPSPLRLALLVGVQEYPHLEEEEQLRGASNDVQLMSDLLTRRFQFPQENVFALRDKDATGAAIRKHLQMLAERIDALPQVTPTYVVFHFSGHGSQIPDQATGPDVDELDGLDETIVPYDAKSQGGDEDIRDDELNAFAQRICGRESTKLWMILDCCHSGTGVRGSLSTRFRVLDRRIKRLNNHPSGSRAVPVVEKTLPSQAVALYACQSVEKEPEFDDAGRSYGLLTRFLSRVLNETSDLSKLSYGMLAREIESRYRQDRRVIPAPMPRVEGQSRDIVCGAGPELDRAPYWEAIPALSDRQMASIAAGSFHGLTAGSLFQLYRSEVDAIAAEDRALAWLRIDEVDLTTSRASVMQRDGDNLFEANWPKNLNQGYAIDRFHDHGDFGARVRVVVAKDEHHDSAPLTQDDPRVPSAVIQAFKLARREGESNWLHWSEASEPFDLLLRIDQRHAAIFPAIAMSYLHKDQIAARGDVAPSLRGGWGPFDLNRQLSQISREIQETIRRITRARNLLRLVDVQRSMDKSNISVALTLERLQVSNGAIVSRVPWLAPNQEVGDPRNEIKISDGSYYDWRVTNAKVADKPVFVTVLQVDSNMGIQVVLPAQLGAESPRLEPGMSITSGGFECCRDEQGKSEFGPRWTILLATFEPNQYSWLSQESLPRIRGTDQIGLSKSAAQRSTLENILLGELYFMSRGDSTLPKYRETVDPTWSVELRRWTAIDTKEEDQE